MRGQAEGSEATMREASRRDAGRGERRAALRSRPGRPRGWYGANRREELQATLSVGYPQGQLTRRTGRRPRCPRTPPCAGAARLPCCPGLGPRRGSSAISQRTLCRSRGQPPLPPGGSGALPLAASALVSAASGQGSRAAQVPGSRTVLCSAQPSLGLTDSELCGPAAEAHPFLPAGWHSLKSVGRRSSRRRGGARVRARPLSPAEGELGRPTEGWRGRPLARTGDLGRGDNPKGPPSKVPRSFLPTPNSP